MHPARIAKSLFAIAALLLASCSPPPTVIPNSLSFTRYQPLYFNVAKVEVVEEYKSPMRAPYVEHLLPYSPAEAMQIWVKDRVRATGSDGVLQIVIKEASVTTTALPRAELGSFLTMDRDKRYDARLVVEMRIYARDSALSKASIAVTGIRSITLPESASNNTRNGVFRRLIFDLMELENAELEKNIFTYFGDYIDYSHSP